MTSQICRRYRSREQQERLRARILSFFNGRFRRRPNAGGVDGGDVQLLRLLQGYAAMAELNPIPDVPGLRCGCRAFRGTLSGRAGRRNAGVDAVMDRVEHARAWLDISRAWAFTKLNSVAYVAPRLLSHNALRSPGSR